MYARQFVTLFGKRTLAQQVAAFFAAGEQGVWYDPSDFSTLWQDAGATVPVTAAGQTVILVLDKSGRGNHATFANCTLAQDGTGFWYLALNGTSTKGVTAAIDFTGTNKMTLLAGLRKGSDAAAGMFAELSLALASNNGAFDIFAPSGAGSNNILVAAKGTTQTNAQATGIVAPATKVICSQIDIAAPSNSLRVNGAVIANTVTSLGTGNFGNHVLNIGANGAGGFFFNGRLYSLILRGAKSTAAEIASGEAYTNSKTGAY